MSFLDIAEIRKRDRAHRPGGEDHVETAVKLHQLYDDRSRALTLSTLQSLGIGDSTDKMPLEIAVLARVCAMQSVIYRMPPVRRLVRDGEEFADDAPEAMALAEAYSRAQLDVILADVERLKNLFRQVVVTLAESEAHGTTVLRVYEPYNVIRDLDPAAADTLEEDSARRATGRRTPATDSSRGSTRTTDRGDASRSTGTARCSRTRSSSTRMG